MNPEGEEFVATSDDGEDSIVRQVVVGICAMEKKSASKPMREILTRLEEFEYLKTAIFPEEVILNVSSQISMSISRRDLTFFFLIPSLSIFHRSLLRIGLFATASWHSTRLASLSIKLSSTPSCASRTSSTTSRCNLTSRIAGPCTPFLRRRASKSRDMPYWTESRKIPRVCICLKDFTISYTSTCISYIILLPLA